MSSLWTGDLVWRRPLPVRSADRFLGAFVLAICLASILLQPGVWIAYPVLLAPVLLLGDSRRGCRITATELRAQGRFMRRVIPLAELTQVGLAPTGTVWVSRRVQGSDPQVSMLRMIPVTAFAGGPPASEQLVIDVRRRARDAGAELEPELTTRTRAPSTKALLFGI